MNSSRSLHWLDNAATSFPKPREVHDAVSAVLSMPGSPGRGSGEAARNADAVLEGARREVASYFGAPRAERVAFTLNATDALNTALAGLVPRGGRVGTSELEHGAVLRPLQTRASAAACDVVRVAPGPDGRVDPRRIAEAAADATLVVLTAASNVTGVAQPVEDVARLLPRGVPFVVDAAQAAGSLPLDAGALGPFAIICFTGHKALLGPMGCGGIIVGEEVDLPPWREGGTGDGAFEQPREMPRRLESGTPPLPAIAGLGAGLRWWASQGPAAVRAREAALIARIVDALREAGAEMPAGPRESDGVLRAPLVAFRLPGWSPAELATVLDAEHGVSLRAGLHCAPVAHRLLGTWPDGLVRASVGPTTPEESVVALCDGIREIAAG